MRTVEENLAKQSRPLGPIWAYLLGSLVAHLLVLVLWTGTPPSGMPGGGVLRLNLAPGLSTALDSDQQEESAKATRAVHSRDAERLVVEKSMEAARQVIQEAAQAVQAVAREPMQKEPEAPLRLLEALTKAEPEPSRSRDERAKPPQDRGETRARTRPERRLAVKPKVYKEPTDQLPAERALPKVQTAVVAKALANPTGRERPVQKPVQRASAGPAAASQVAGIGGGAGGDAYRRVQTALRRALLPRFDYPMLARRRGWEGRVRVSVLVEPDGDLKNIQVVESCGYRVLDEAALDDLREVGRLPEVDAWLGGQEISVILPIQYRLK